MQNGIIESFNGRLRDECLNANWFRNLRHARLAVAAWRTEYNQRRPHSALGYRTPHEFANRDLPVMPGGARSVVYRAKGKTDARSYV